MTVFAALLWMSSVCVVYTYAGYPFLLIVIASMSQLRSDWHRASSFQSRRVTAARATPRVAVLVAAFNEERHIAERIQNLLEQTYPGELLQIYVGSDASSDRTAEIARSFGRERVTFVDFPDRRGKASVINDLAAMCTEDVLVFTDANTLFNPDAVQKLVRHFGKPEIGCVCGELRLIREGSGGDNQDHIYWRYERLLKFFESRIGALLGANGGVYAMRREDYSPIPADTIVDDFWISMRVVEAGRRCVYDSEAVATETIPLRMRDEFSRRVRIGIGNYQSLVRFAHLLDPRRGVLAFVFLSHRVLRWFAPHFMVLALLCNLMLVGDALYAAWFAAQVLFYGLAWLGWRLSRVGDAPRALRLPLFFVSMNLGLLVGFCKFATRTSSGVWSRSAR